MGYVQFNMSRPVDRTFVLELFAAAKSAGEFKMLLEFGLPALLQHQTLLVEVLGREADRRAAHSHKSAGESLPAILAELGLKVVLEPPAEPHQIVTADR